MTVVWPWKTAHYENANQQKESQLIKQAILNPAAFAPLYEEYFPRIYNYCLRRTGGPEEAEDLASLVFTRALVGLPGFKGGSFGAWLFQIAHNTVLNAWRARPKQVNPEGSLDELRDSFAEKTLLDNYIFGEEKLLIARLFKTLSPEQQELLLLKIVGRLSAREVGQILGKSEGAVRTALHRAIQELRQRYLQTSGEELNEPV